MNKEKIKKEFYKRNKSHFKNGIEYKAVNTLVIQVAPVYWPSG